MTTRLLTIRASRLLVAVLVACQAPVSWAAQAPPSPAKTEQIIFNDYETATFETLVTKSDPIILGTVKAERTFLLGDRILTHYEVIVDRVIKSTRTPGPATGGVLEVRRSGGTMTVERRSVVARESQFPPFIKGDRYLLFLTPGDAGAYYQVSWGPQGAFTLTNGMVRQMSEGVAPPWNRKRGDVTLDAFLQDIQKAAASQR
jgi:hypothetical protein